MVPQTLLMKKLLLTALLFFCVACFAFTRNSPRPVISSFWSTAPLSDATAPTDATTPTNTTAPSDTTFPTDTTAPTDSSGPIVTTILAPSQTSPGRQPPRGTLSPARPVTLRILLRDLTLKPSGLVLEWELQVNGMPRQKGTVSNLLFGPQHTALVHLPVRPPTGIDDEAFLQVRYRSRPQTLPPSSARPPTPSSPITRRGGATTTPAGPIIAEQQLLLVARTGNDLAIRPTGELSFTDTNDIFTVRSPSIHLEFNKQTGWLQRYEVKGTALLPDSTALRSLFRLPAADTASHLTDSADPWQEANRDPHLQLFSTSTGSEMVIVRAEYTLPATSCLLHLSYTVNAAGEILVGQSMESDSTQKGWPLPCFGMQWPLPAGFDSSVYDGLGKPQPDSGRKATAWIGIYRQQLSEPPSYPPGSTTTHSPLAATAVRWWTITGPKGVGLLITADSSLFNGNLGKGSPFLLNIFYRQPPADDSSGNTPGSSFHLPYANYRFTYKVTPLTPDHP